MKLATFKNRIKKSNSGTKGKEIALYLLSNSTFDWNYDGKLRSCWTSGTGRFTKNMDYTEDTKNALHFAGLKENVHYCVKNDSPKNGKCGNYFELTSKGRRKMIK